MSLKNIKYVKKTFTSHLVKTPSLRSALNSDVNDISWKKGHHVCRVLGLVIKIMGMQNISSILVCTIKQAKKKIHNVWSLMVIVSLDRKICMKDIICLIFVNT